MHGHIQSIDSRHRRTDQQRASCFAPARVSKHKRAHARRAFDSPPSGGSLKIVTRHRQIEGALDRFDELRRITDRATILQLHEQEVQMRDLFDSHCHKEEASLYPAMDLAFNPSEKRNLLPVIQAFEI